MAVIQPPTAVKICSSCKRILPLAEFAKLKKGYGGLNPTCRKCKSDYMKARRQKLAEVDKEIPPLKVCTRCKVVKTQEEFHRCSVTKDGLQDACKPCQIEQHNKGNASDWSRTYVAKRMANINDGPVDTDITLEKLFKRDKGICGICKLECLWEDSSVDHITAVSKGGHHIWSNIQLAHRRCNSAKGNR